MIDVMYYIGAVPFGGDDVQHFGIKGMKWGVRRTPEQLGHKSAGPKKIKRPQAHTINPKKKIKIDPNMSDDELRSRINRLKMEEEYKRLLYAPEKEKTTSVGKKLVIAGLKEIGLAAVKGLFDTMKETAKYAASGDDSSKNDKRNKKDNKKDANAKQSESEYVGRHSPGNVPGKHSPERRRRKGEQATESILSRLGDYKMSALTEEAPAGRQRGSDRLATTELLRGGLR